MKLRFMGAVRTVTGSMHMLTVNGSNILLDCGLFQGRRQEAFERNRNLPFKVGDVDALILSHAHIDHSGNIPSLVKSGFRGDIFATFATRDLCAAMLPDSAHIQEQDVEYVNKKRGRKGLPPVEPLYSKQDANESLKYFVGAGYDRTFDVVPGLRATFRDAGHILGSAITVLDIEENGQQCRLAFSGDLGRKNLPILRDPSPIHDVDYLIIESTYGNRQHETPEEAQAALRRVVTETYRRGGKVIIPAFSVGRKNAPILRDPTPIHDVDYLIIESTYGNRQHETPEEAQAALRRVVNDTYRRGGKVIIPAFSVGRTQEIVYTLHLLTEARKIPQLPIFVDSPLSVNVTEVFRLHPECYDEETAQFILGDRHPDPFGFKRMHYIRDVEDSKELQFLREPAVIISASGMCEAGRILHHLKNNIEDSRNTVLIVGWQAPHTLGRKLVERWEKVKIFGEEYPLRAEVEVIGGYSAHADRGELLDYVRKLNNGRLKKVFVVHGEEEASLALAAGLRELGVPEAIVPEPMQEVVL